MGFSPILSLIILGAVSTAEAFHLESVSGPSPANQSTIVRRYTHFVLNDHAILAKCDEIEPECTPGTGGLKIRREMPFTVYQSELARHFEIEPRYLLNDDKTVLNLEALQRTLLEIIEAENVDQDERKAARDKFDNLTKRGGIKDRFTQARAIKRGMMAAETTSFEKSQKQFAEMNTPFDFVADRDAKDPYVIYESSTEKIYWLASAAATRAEAKKLCATRGRGFDLPRAASELPRWLIGSAIGAAIPAAAGRGKSVWLAGERVSRRDATIDKWPENVTGVDVKPYKVHVTVSDAIFEAAQIHDRGASVRDVTVAGGHSDLRKDDEILATLAVQAGRLAVVCISALPDDDTY